MGVGRIFVLVSALVLLFVPPSSSTEGTPWDFPGSWMPPSYGPNFGPPDLGNITCEDVGCGNGNCTMSKSNHSSSSSANDGSSYSYSYNYSYSFQCSCEPGWNRSAASSYQYLPCVIPNCEFSDSCVQNRSSFLPKITPPEMPYDQNNIMNACTWAICGQGGTCVNTSSFNYKCNCEEGFINLLGMEGLPCYKPCPQNDPGAQCKQLGIGSIKSSSGASDQNKSKGVTTATSGMKLLALVIFMVSLITSAS
ncbi:hypothetical protein ZOSMA_289G00060 [Zostera marina]|uniref:EGF-like domain-containing protein n=1 Tax=Zostera marina TaxID=29655 RepID=A0A0K9PEX3_ZOSMR|nr:hypothetical protein ZOSMA_289G00060 [Zostera marina]